MWTGNKVYFSIQYRRTHTSPWQKPLEPLEPVDRSKCLDWGMAGGNILSGVETKKQRQERDDLWQETGQFGWAKVGTAISVLNKVKIEDAEGSNDSYDGYRHHDQAVRHEFRLVRCYWEFKVDVLDANQVIEFLA